MEVQENFIPIGYKDMINYDFSIITFPCSETFDPLESRTMVCKLAGVDALLMITDDPLLSAGHSFAISSSKLRTAIGLETLGILAACDSSGASMIFVL